jgi:hypothetical protein
VEKLEQTARSGAISVEPAELGMIFQRTGEIIDEMSKYLQSATGDGSIV